MYNIKVPFPVLSEAEKREDMIKKFVIMMSFVVVALCSQAATETVNGITWTYSVSDGKATVTDVPTSVSGSITIPSILGGYPVMSIGYSAFSSCSKLTSVTIPDSVTSIGNQVFSYCRSLTSVRIPDSVMSIGEYAFYECRSLENVTIGNGVTSIGYGAFFYCDSLVSLAIGNSVTSIGDWAFSECHSLMSVTIPDTVISIGSCAFDGCRLLTSVTIGNNVMSIGSSAFEDCCLLTSVTIPDSVMSIGEYAFYNCRSLTSVTIPDRVMSIGYYAFYSCSSLVVAYVSVSYKENLNIDIFPHNTDIVRYKPVMAVFLDANGGEVEQATLERRFRSIYGEMPVPSRVGFVFDGWYLDEERVFDETVVDAIDDHTLVAKWIPNKYTITFDANGGECGASELWEYGTPLPVATREGYRFLGWFTEPAGGAKITDDVEITDDMTFYAQWQKTWNVTFDANGYVDENPLSVVVGDNGMIGELPVVKSYGYAFLGWWTDKDGGEMVTAETIVTSDMVLYAHWERLVVSKPIVTSSSGMPFYDDSTVVSLFCSMDGATIYY